MLGLSDKQTTKKERKELIEAVHTALEELLMSQQHIDFKAVARKLGIARSTLYRNPIVREEIAAAREKSRVSSISLPQLQEEIRLLKERVQKLEDVSHQWEP
ncbi:DUF6262 family protein [Aminobacterium colombiense]|uniref:Putative TetR family transcriptional regulator n=1 Tax=Aminobacterium colombiense (strain DSM 12261 / ALA-1) TaxID=572547 RepID=D5ECA2_AMICL|nr:DUF6262 family protein [Aminobacterium colombiense]ADE56184.1 putative TetR family transcriptional regulator [Aminobacterium colombiense DSM 12261]